MGRIWQFIFHFLKFFPIDFYFGITRVCGSKIMGREKIKHVL